jgi:fibronectin type 3 domain-containing protein
MIIIVFLFGSCSLDRKNPLDPHGNDNIEVPLMVVGLELSSTGGVVNIRWQRSEKVNKYRLYRSQSYDGAYELIQTIAMTGLETENTVTAVDDNVALQQYYYYKVSAVNVQGLEGPISSYKYVLVRM